MKFLLLVVLFLTSICYAQTPLPTMWYGAGAAYSAPSYNGWISMAYQVKSGMYSFTSYDITPAPTPTNKFGYQTSVRTGFAYLIGNMGHFYLMEFLDGGVAATPTGLGGAGSLGGAGIYRIGAHFNIIGAYRLIKTNLTPTNNVKEIGVGWAF
jgi:hypothetical protein